MFKLARTAHTFDAYVWALFKNRRYDAARKASERALKVGTPEALFFYRAGMIANESGDAARAKDLGTDSFGFPR
jgi:hypothetical protein